MFSAQHTCLTLQHENGILVPSLSLVTAEPERQEVLKRLGRQYGMNTLKSFPGGHPMTVMRHDVRRVISEDCMVSLKTDGVRYLLLLSTIDGCYKAHCIDRCMRIYEIFVWSSEEYFDQETLLDGELAVDHSNSRLCYQIFDVVCMKGVSCKHMKYCDRLQVIHNHIISDLPAGMHDDSPEAEQYIVDENKLYSPVLNYMNLRFVPKRFVAWKNGRKLWEDRYANPFPNDGLVINFNHSPIHPGTARHTFKWKPHNAIDVVISSSLEVSCRCDGEEQAFTHVDFNGETYQVCVEDNHLIQVLFYSSERSRVLVECLISLKNKKAVLWPMKERIDKSDANDIKVIQSTLSAIDDHVTLEDIFPHSRGVADETASSDLPRVSNEQAAEKEDEQTAPTALRRSKRRKTGQNH